jgi:hypothetical protein
MQIPIILPRSFERALGYPGGSRWVAFYWEPCGDEAMYDDGLCSGDGNWWGFRRFIEHPSVAPWLTGCDLGSSDSEASHYLLCDLDSRDVFIGEKGEVRSFLLEEVKRNIPGVSKPLTPIISPDEMKDLLTKIRDNMQEMPAPSITELEEKMRRDQEAVEKMVAELGEMGES